MANTAAGDLQPLELSVVNSKALSLDPAPSSLQLSFYPPALLQLTAVHQAPF